MSDSGAPKHWPFFVTEPSDFRVPERSVRAIVVHTVYEKQEEKEAFAEMLNEKHMLEGWQGIGYHYVIDHLGNIVAARPVNEIATMGDVDTIAVVRNSQNELTRDSATNLCAEVQSRYELAGKTIFVEYA